MTEMTTSPAHAKPALRDHMWVLAVIAGFALYDVWESWTQVGNKSGFAHGTGWTLTVIVEVYAAYALFGWFGAPGVRSRRFAMWSAFGVLVLSLIGQGSSVLAAAAMPPLWLAVFVKDLPVVVLALIAVLIHLRRLDRAESAAAEEVRVRAAQEAREAATAADERTVLRGELEAARAALEPLRAELETARNELGRVTAKAEAAEAKLAAASQRKKASVSRAKKDSGSPRTGVPRDVDARAEALAVLASEPGISGAALGERVGRTARWGQMFLKDLTAAPADAVVGRQDSAAPHGQSPQE